jgi:hypothetical protein
MHLFTPGSVCTQRNVLRGSVHGSMPWIAENSLLPRSDSFTPVRERAAYLRQM